MNILIRARSALTERMYDCPSTGKRLLFRLPTRKQHRQAQTHADRTCGKPTTVVNTATNEIGNIDAQLVAAREEAITDFLLARCVYVDGEAQPVGSQVIDELDVVTYGEWDRLLEEMIDDRSLRNLTDDEVAEYIADLKKSGKPSPASLTTIGRSTLCALVLALIAAQRTSTT